MSPVQFYSKKEINPNNIHPSHALKINKNSQFIKKSSSSVSAPTVATKTPPRQPVIIYTHSPKVIHTNPNDFMALVQKLTGLSQVDRNPNPSPKTEPKGEAHGLDDLNKNSPKSAISDDSESSVITDDFCPGTILDNVNFNSFLPSTPILYPNTSPCFNNIPMFMPNDSLCSINSFLNNYADQLLLMPNMRSSTSPSTNLEALKEFHEF